MANDLPAFFRGIGYATSRSGLPLVAFGLPVPRPGPDQLLIHVSASSLNPLEYKLAELNFLERDPPVVLGFDLAGTVVQVGEAVVGFTVGDQVVAMADCDGDGGWAEGGTGGYALARHYLTVQRPQSLPVIDAAALPVCFLAAYLGLKPNLREGDTIYVPGGGGGVGHLAVQIAARALGAGYVISSAGKAESADVARLSGADLVLDYRGGDVEEGIAEATSGRGVDIVFDATYNESGFANTAGYVRDGGNWVVLGVGPGRTSRLVQTESPVDEILSRKGAKHVNANMLDYFTKPETLDARAKSFLRKAMDDMALWSADGRVRAHIDGALDSSAARISEGLALLKTGGAGPGKTVVIVDRGGV